MPPDYVLGPGDSIRVQLFGNINGIYEFEVTRDGILNLPELGPVTVAGLPFSEFRRALLRIHTWNLLLRHMEINRKGVPDSRHTLSATPQDLIDIQLSYDSLTAFGRIYAGIGYSQLDDELSGLTTSEASGFLRWSLR